MSKRQLYNLVESKRQKNRIDQILNADGHGTLRLPLTSRLSPIELDWAAVRRFIRGNNMGAEFSLNRLRDFTDVGISSVTGNTMPPCEGN
jgi:hypothetical protein